MTRQLHYKKINTCDFKNPLTPVGEFKIVGNVIRSLDQISTTDPEAVEKLFLRKDENCILKG